MASVRTLGRNAGLVLAGVVSAVVLVQGGCPQPQYTQMIEGVTLAQVREITEKSTSELSNDAKRQALKDLGVTNEQLVELLLNAYPPASTGI